MAEPIDIGVPGVSSENASGTTQAITKMMATMDELGKEWYVGTLWEWPPEFQEAKDKINEVAQWLLMILDLVASILEIAKAFIMAYLNPIGTLVSMIIQEINDFLKDLQQWGIYLAADGINDGLLWEYPFADFLGGYQAFERRMIGKLTNRDDYSRPDVSYKTPCLTAFMYASVDVSGIVKLIKLIQLILKLFSFKAVGNALPACGPVKVSYGLLGASPGMQFLTQAISTAVESGDSDLTINLEWNLQRGSSFAGITLPQPPIQGFVIEVSTIKGGLPLFYNYVSNSASTADGVSTKELRKTMPLYDQAGQPLVLFGGWDQIAESSTFYGVDLSPDGKFKSGPDGLTVTPGSTIVFAKRTPNDNQLIPLDKLRSDDGEKYFLQRTFIVGQEENAFVPGNTFRFVLNPKELPYEATFDMGSGGKIIVNEGDQPSNYFIRIRTTTDAVEEAENNTLKTPLVSNPYQYDLKKWFSSSENGKKLSVVPMIKGPDGKPGEIQALVGFPSPVKMINNPNKDTKGFIESVKTALALLVLCRADFQVIEETRVFFKSGDNSLKGYVDANGAVVSSKRVRDENLIDPLEYEALMKKELPPQAIRNLAKKPTNLEQFTREFGMLTNNEGDAFFRGAKPAEWSAKLLDEVNDLASEMYSLMGSQPALEKMVAERTKLLRNITISELSQGMVEGDLTILEFLDTSKRAKQAKEAGGWSPAGEYFFGGSMESFLSKASLFESFLLNVDNEDHSGNFFVDDYATYNPPSHKVVTEFYDSDDEFVSRVRGDSGFRAQVEESITQRRFKRIRGVKAGVTEGPKVLNMAPEGGIDAGSLSGAEALITEIYAQQGYTYGIARDICPEHYTKVYGAYQKAKATTNALDPAGKLSLKAWDDLIADFEKKTAFKYKEVFSKVQFWNSAVPMLATPNVVNAIADPAFTYDGNMEFYAISVRDLILKHPQILVEAQLALNVAAAAFNKYGDGAWLNVRFFGAVKGLEDFMELIRKWLAIINKAIQSVADFIIAYIDYVLARIREIQKFIRTLNRLLQSITLFDIPKAAMLLTLSDGTDGIVTDLVAAENKPQDGPKAYGAGACIVFPTVPNGKFVLELIMAIAEAAKDDSEGEGDDVPQGES